MKAVSLLVSTVLATSSVKQAPQGLAAPLVRKPLTDVSAPPMAPGSGQLALSARNGQSEAPLKRKSHSPRGRHVSRSQAPASGAVASGHHALSARNGHSAPLKRSSAHGTAVGGAHGGAHGGAPSGQTPSHKTGGAHNGFEAALKRRTHSVKSSSHANAGAASGRNGIMSSIRRRAEQGLKKQKTSSIKGFASSAQGATSARHGHNGPLKRRTHKTNGRQAHMVSAPSNRIMLPVKTGRLAHTPSTGEGVEQDGSIARRGAPGLMERMLGTGVQKASPTPKQPVPSKLRGREFAPVAEEGLVSKFLSFAYKQTDEEPIQRASLDSISKPNWGLSA